MARPAVSAQDASRPLWRIYLAFLGPMVLANILQSLSGSVNAVYIGQMLGTQALAAVAGMFPIVFFFIALIIGVGAGASVLIGQAWGAREPAKVKAIAGTALGLGGLIGIAAAVLGELFAKQVLQALGTPAEVLPDAVAYARVMMLTMPLLLVFILYTQLLRGVGDTLTPLYALMLSTGIGLVLTPALIRGWGGLPQLGVVSAAVAGLVSFAVALTFLVIYLQRKRHPLAPDAALRRAIHTLIEHERIQTARALGEREDDFLRLTVEGVAFHAEPFDHCWARQAGMGSERSSPFETNSAPDGLRQSNLTGDT